MYIPLHLKTLPNWILWRLETNEKGKPTKVPYQASGRRASSTDPRTWRYLHDIEADYTAEFDGLGINAGQKASGLVLIDLDHCIDHEGNIEPWAKTIIETANSYTELSPSEKGIHIICGGVWDVPGKKTSCAEMYGYARYFTYTGNVYEDRKELRTLSHAELQRIHQLVSATGPEVVDSASNDLPQGTCTMPVDEILSKMAMSKNADRIMSLYNGDLSRHNGDASSADMALCMHLAFWTNRDAQIMDEIFRTSKLMRPKWDEKRGEHTYGHRTIMVAISKCLTTYKKYEKRPAPLFWYDDTSKKTNCLKIDNAGMLRYLREIGYTKYYPKTAIGEPRSTFVHIENRLVSIASKEKLNDEVHTYISRQSDPVLPDTTYSKHELENLYLKGANIYLSVDRLQCMPPTRIDFYRDTAKEAAIFFSDYWACIDKGGIIKRPYSELSGYLWDKQKLKKPFPQGEETDNNGEFSKFVARACGNDPHIFQSVKTALGYLAHRYKDPSNTKAVVFLDAIISDVPSGRSGKSLILSALSQIRSVVMMDGKTLDNENDRFAFQNVGADTDIAVLDDIKEKFNFESVFHLITGDFGIEKKGQQKQIIPFDESPKIAFSSNYMLNGEGSSFEARVFEIALPSIYNKDFTPERDFGHKLFIDWDQNEWNRFYWFMMDCIRLYLNIGLYPHKHENIDKRKLIQKTCESFVIFMDNYFDDYKVPEKYDGWEQKEPMYLEYLTVGGKNQYKFTKEVFGRWMATYFRCRGIAFETAQRRMNIDGIETKVSCFRIIK